MQFRKLAILTAISFVSEAAANNYGHRHLHQHGKKALVTNVEIVTVWKTVTVSPGEVPTEAAPAPEGSIAAQGASVDGQPDSEVRPTQTKPIPTPIVFPNTPPVEPTSCSLTDAHVSAGSPSSTPFTDNTPASAPASIPIPSGGEAKASGSSKRGLAYNTFDYLRDFTAGGLFNGAMTYNWGSLPQGDMKSLGFDFAGMLHQPTDQFVTWWYANYPQLLDDGYTHFLSFNECDNPGQCNASPSVAADAHATHMNKVYTDGKSKGMNIRIGSPAITSDVAPGKGIEWLSQFFDACAGRCQVDFVSAHWYGPDSTTLLNYLLALNEALGGKYPIWLTEYQQVNPTQEVSEFIKDTIFHLEHNSTFDFVEKHFYFFVDNTDKFANNLLTSGQLNDFGKVYANYNAI